MRYGLCLLLKAERWPTVVNFCVIWSLVESCLIGNCTTSSFLYKWYQFFCNRCAINVSSSMLEDKRLKIQSLLKIWRAIINKNGAKSTAKAGQEFIALHEADTFLNSATSRCLDRSYFYFFSGQNHLINYIISNYVKISNLLLLMISEISKYVTFPYKKDMDCL